MLVCVFCVGGGSLGLQRYLSTSSSSHSLVTGCMMELHTPVVQYLLVTTNALHNMNSLRNLIRHVYCRQSNILQSTETIWTCLFQLPLG